MKEKGDERKLLQEIITCSDFTSEVLREFIPQNNLKSFSTFKVELWLLVWKQVKFQSFLKNYSSSFSWWVIPEILPMFGNIWGSSQTLKLRLDEGDVINMLRMLWGSSQTLKLRLNEGDVINMKGSLVNN